MCLLLANWHYLGSPGHIVNNSQVLIWDCRKRFMAKCLALIDVSGEVHRRCGSAVPDSRS